MTALLPLVVAGIGLVAALIAWAILWRQTGRLRGPHITTSAAARAGVARWAATAEALDPRSGDTATVSVLVASHDRVAACRVAERAALRHLAAGGAGWWCRTDETPSA